MGPKATLDVFFRCSKKMKGQRTDQDEVTFVGGGSTCRPIKMQICHKAVSSSSLTHPPCPEKELNLYTRNPTYNHINS